VYLLVALPIEATKRFPVVGSGKLEDIELLRQNEACCVDESVPSGNRVAGFLGFLLMGDVA